MPPDNPGRFDVSDELPFRLQLDSGVPAYRQIMNQVRYFLASGLLRRGGQLPSIRELARTLAINPGTVVKAYTELEHEGLAASRHGRGYFIAEQPIPLTREEREAPVREAARRLWVAASQVGVSAERTRQLIDEEGQLLASDPSFQNPDSLVKS